MHDRGAAKRGAGERRPGSQVDRALGLAMGLAVSITLALAPACVHVARDVVHLRMA